MKSLNLKLFAKSARIAILAPLAMVCFTAHARAQGITVAQLAGPWQITLVGNSGCGQTSMLFSGTLNTSGTGAGTLTASSGCGMGSSTQTFTITGLTYYGTGSASLSCGAGCGWNFDIQVAADKQEFNLVDVENGGANILAGTALAVVESAPPITIAQLAGPWQVTLVGNTGCGRTSMLFSGTLNTSGAGTGPLTATSGCTIIFFNPPTIQTFAITALNAQGFGRATLSCGAGCAWNFDIQVAADKQEFSLVDVENGGANILAGTAVAEVASAQPITVAQLAARGWRMAIVGNTGCGQTSIMFDAYDLDTSGTGTGTLTASSGCGMSSSTQSFKITSLNAQGFGSATLSCGSGCAWNFDIQVAANELEFSLVDVANGGANVLAGTAIAHQASFQL